MTGNTNRVIFTLCKHCGRAISLNPATWFTDPNTGNFMRPDWNGKRYWCHFDLVADNHLPEPKKPFVDHVEGEVMHQVVAAQAAEVAALYGAPAHMMGWRLQVVRIYDSVPGLTVAKIIVRQR